MSSRKEQFKERFTVGFTAEQTRRMDELIRVRARRGELTSRAHIVREALGFYLQHQPDLVGARKAIAKDLEGKIDELDTKVESLTALFTNFLESIRRRRDG